jgi:hypothetical protein
MNRLRVALSALLSLSIVACGSAGGLPTEADGRRTVEQYLTGPGCEATVLSFKKLNGVERSESGVRGYVMDFEATLEPRDMRSRACRHIRPQGQGQILWVFTEKGWVVRGVRMPGM